jgi:hypothetical protein
LIEAADCDLTERGLTRRGDARNLLQLRLQASRRLEAWLAAYGLTPRGRVELAREAAQGGLAAEIARRRASSNGEAPRRARPTGAPSWRRSSTLAIPE